MCVIIDSCCLASVFQTSSKNHEQYKPMLNWIVSGSGKVIYGGTTYKKELSKAQKYLRLLGRLKTAGKFIEADCKDVDSAEEAIKQNISHHAFDDHHIIAIINVTNCRLVCTNDDLLIRFLKMKKTYSAQIIKKPKIYKNKSHKELLQRRDLTECSFCLS